MSGLSVNMPTTILAAGCTICAVLWWGLRIGEAWESLSPKRATLLFLIPVATLIVSWSVGDDVFRLTLLLLVIASLVHIVITVWKKPRRVSAAILAGVFFLAIGGSGAIFVSKYGFTAAGYAGLPNVHGGGYVPDVVKQDCQRLVEGQLVFTPTATMQQGKPYLVSARLSRGKDTNIASGLHKGTIIIEDTKVSCMVSMTLDSQEPNAFKIDNIPAARPNEQILLPNRFAQWDWRVTPLKSGTLHLLLYVTPMLYVDEVGQGLQQYPQAPRVITVSPDYLYVLWTAISTNWEIWGTLLTVIVVPLLLWLGARFKTWRDKRNARKPSGFGKAVGE